ncbi:MAG: bifunctional phosphoglucose/phosphomannose isomerase [Candidatus Marinimicrobia bacterium]|nr:bifunctional phosphoglucose/phosphomannose isomerase [Candidatus Neomarinimicrobiota bacterium]|tara:strand:- start:5216 stop:6262 length:1047 start_codon:yes stop_codon:yes gene_type:complete
MSFSNQSVSEIDVHNMREQIESIYIQIKDSLNLMNDFIKKDSSYKNIIYRYDNILIIGMGGSAIGADFARTIIQQDSLLPVFVVRDYFIPGWVNNKTFVIACSYSGNTEETLTAYNQCLNRKCMSIVISTGGKIVEIANANNIGVLKIPEGFQPRAAIGYSLTLFLLLFKELGIIKDDLIGDLDIVIKNKLGLHYVNQAKLIANKLHGTLPIIYSSEGYMSVLAIRLKSQLAENAKMLSYQSTLPEQNHNEIEGWCNQKKIMSLISVVWLKDVDDSIFIKKGMHNVKKIIKNHPYQHVDIEVDKGTFLERIYAMIHFVDWISFYLAILYKSNPALIGNILRLKSSHKE